LLVDQSVFMAWYLVKQGDKFTFYIFLSFPCYPYAGYWIFIIFCGPPPWWLGEGLKSPHRKKTACYEMLRVNRALEEGSCEHCNKPSSSTKGGDFLDYHSGY